MNMTQQEFLRALEDTLGMSAGSIKGDEALRDLPVWDSMAAVSFLAMADERFQQAIPASQLASCKSVSDLAALFPGKIS